MLKYILRRTIWSRKSYLLRPPASEVLACHLRECRYPWWTSYFVRYASVQDDDFGRSHFNFEVDGSNYHILRTGCYPFIKYHCTKRRHESLDFDDKFFRILKLANLGLPCLCYGIAAIFLARIIVTVKTSKGNVKLYFMNYEEPNAQY